MTPLFHFQQLIEDRWVPIGAGLGEGDDDAAHQALEDLRELSGGALAAGEYQMIEVGATSATWSSFRLGDDGRIVESSPTADDRGVVCFASKPDFPPAFD